MYSFPGLLCSVVWDEGPHHFCSRSEGVPGVQVFEHLTFNLIAVGKLSGFILFVRLIPYGKVEQVLPYLVRRAQENGDVLRNGVDQERGFYLSELTRRFFRGV